MDVDPTSLRRIEVDTTSLGHHVTATFLQSTRSGHILLFLLPLVQEGQLSVTGEVLVNRLGGLSLSRKSVVRLIDRPDMTLDVYHGRKTTTQYNNFQSNTTQCLSSLNKRNHGQTRCQEILYTVELQ